MRSSKTTKPKSLLALLSRTVQQQLPLGVTPCSKMDMAMRMPELRSCFER